MQKKIELPETLLCRWEGKGNNRFEVFSKNGLTIYLECILSDIKRIIEYNKKTNNLVCKNDPYEEGQKRRLFIISYFIQFNIEKETK